MPLPFNSRLAIGEDIERATAEYIVKNLGADVEKIGSLEDDDVLKPLTWRNIDGIHRRLISPDLNVYKEGQYFSVQVKHKNTIIHADSMMNKQGFYLDVREHTRLSRLNHSRPCILLIHCAGLPSLTVMHPELPNFREPFVFVSMDDLEPNQTLLHRRSVAGKDVFLLPLKLFKPLSELFNRKVLNEPTNTNAKPQNKSL